MRAHVGRPGTGAEYSSCIIFVMYSTVGRTCRKKTAYLNFLYLLPMVLKTRGLGTGATYMRGSYVAEPRLLAPGFVNALCYSSQSMNSTTGSEYTENTYIHLKLIFAFAAQSSLSKVRNDNVRNAVRTRGTCAVPTRYGTAASVPHTQTSSRNPLFRYRYYRALSQDLHQSSLYITYNYIYMTQYFALLMT